MALPRLVGGVSGQLWSGLARGTHGEPASFHSRPDTPPISLVKAIDFFYTVSYFGHPLSPTF